MPILIELKNLAENDKIKWSLHAMKRLRERHISIDDFLNAITTGEIIEQYPDDYPTPSCLLIGATVSGKPLHIVVGCDDAFIYAITAYYPDPNEWESDLKTRKEY